MPVISGVPDCGQGRVHVLVVRALGEPCPVDGLREITDCEITHLPTLLGCQVRQIECGGYTREVWQCDVGWQEAEGDLAFSLRYSGTPVTKPGTYRIRGWWSRAWYHEWGNYEYDNGIAVVEGAGIDAG